MIRFINGFQIGVVRFSDRFLFFEEIFFHSCMEFQNAPIVLSKIFRIMYMLDSSKATIRFERKSKNDRENGRKRYQTTFISPRRLVASSQFPGESLVLRGCFEVPRHFGATKLQTLERASLGEKVSHLDIVRRLVSSRVCSVQVRKQRSIAFDDLVTR